MPLQVEQRLHFAGSQVCRVLRVLLAMLNNSLLYLGPFVSKYHVSIVMFDITQALS